MLDSGLIGWEKSVLGLLKAGGKNADLYSTMFWVALMGVDEKPGFRQVFPGPLQAILHSFYVLFRSVVGKFLHLFHNPNNKYLLTFNNLLVAGGLL